MRKIMLVGKKALLLETYPSNFVEAVAGFAIPLDWRIPTVAEMRAIRRIDPEALGRFLTMASLPFGTAFFTRTIRCTGDVAEVLTMSPGGDTWWASIHDRLHNARLLLTEHRTLKGDYTIV